MVLGSPQVELLSILLTAAGHTVSTSRLADLLWGDSARPSIGGALRGSISTLRRALASEDDSRTPIATSNVIITVGSGTDVGYRLNPLAVSIDSRSFEHGYAEGRRQLRNRQPGPAAALFAAALDLWKGPPFAQVASRPFAIVEVAKLNALRRSAQTAYVGALFSLGRDEEAVAHLSGVIAENPDDQSLRRLLAVHRGGATPRGSQVTCCCDLGATDI